MSILAIDLGKYKSVACQFTSPDADVHFHTVASDPHHFRQLIRLTNPDIVVFETCTSAGWVSDLCELMNVNYVVANPGGEAWRWKNVKRKTDRDDALKLARLYHMGELPIVYMPPYAVRAKRALLKFRESIVSQRVGIQNEIRAVFHAQGIQIARGASLWTKAGFEMMERESRELLDCGPEQFWRGQLRLLVESYRRIESQERWVDRKLEHLAREDKNVQRLMTIPGVGRCTAEVICAYIGDPHRFKNAREVSSYAGMVPSQYQSGEQDRRGRITKRGPHLLRKRLVECSWLLLRYNEWGQQLHARISRGHKTRKKQAAVALARRLLVRCWAMLRDETDWDDSLAKVEPSSKENQHTVPPTAVG